MGTELDQTRLAALHQAAHDLRGGATAEETVTRAKVYLAFLDEDVKVWAVMEKALDAISGLTPDQKKELDKLLAPELRAARQAPSGSHHDRPN